MATNTPKLIVIPWLKVEVTLWLPPIPPLLLSLSLLLLSWLMLLLDEDDAEVKEAGQLDKVERSVSNTMAKDLKSFSWLILIDMEKKETSDIFMQR